MPTRIGRDDFNAHEREIIFDATRAELNENVGQDGFNSSFYQLWVYSRQGINQFFLLADLL